MIIKKYPAEPKSIPEILKFVREIYTKTKIDRPTILEYELLSEELLLQLITASSSDAEIQVSFDRKLGGNKLVFSCEGEAIDLEAASENDISLKIISDYSERLSQTRRHGINYITLTTNTSSNMMTKQLIVATFLAVVTCLVLTLCLNIDQIKWVVSQISEPLVIVYIKLLQIFALPVAFLSLVTYIINYHESVEYDDKLKQISLRFVFSSIIAVLIAFVVWKIAEPGLTALTQSAVNNVAATASDNHFFGNTLSDFITQMIPENLIEIFTLTNPLPMLVIAIILGLGINSYSNNSNIRLRNAFNDLMELISHLISMVYGLLPISLYFSIIYSFLYRFATGEIKELVLVVLGAALLIFIVFLLQYTFYFIQLCAFHISPKAFYKKYKDMLWENIKIASNIDALPYNMRSFRRKLGKKGNSPLVRATLNLGTLMNMDGNCLIITMGILIFNFLFGSPLSIWVLIELFIIILLLGIGSPNQPGSYTIATVVLLPFLGIDSSYTGFVIILEAIFCKLYSATNSIGDIITVTILADDELKKKPAPQ